MKHLWITLALLLPGVWAQAQGDTLKYRVTLRDKAQTEYSLQRPEEFLSAKALERRARQGIAVDSTDLPVCRTYINKVKELGARIVVTGKWENFITVSCNDTTVMDAVAALPFVRSVEQVWKVPASALTPKADKRDSLVNHPAIHPDSIYGTAITQIAMSRGDELHKAGFRGEGMTIAVIDAGYHNVDRITAMRNIRIRGTRDFVEPGSDIYAKGSHGMSVLSCMAMNMPNVMTGTAPEASYWLLRSEDERSEQPVEQDYWAAAVEFADSVGVDVLNTSLGYYVYDDPAQNLRLRDLDGQHQLMSRQASRIADKGMILVCSAGNAGMESWKKITTSLLLHRQHAGRAHQARCGGRGTGFGRHADQWKHGTRQRHFLCIAHPMWYGGMPLAGLSGPHGQGGHQAGAPCGRPRGLSRQHLRLRGTRPLEGFAGVSLGTLTKFHPGWNPVPLYMELGSVPDGTPFTP